MPSAAIIDFETARTRLRRGAATHMAQAAFWYAVPVWPVLMLPMATPAAFHQHSV
jgi:hypothetical protein